jgi:hypothetical protein
VTAAAIVTAVVGAAAFAGPATASGGPRQHLRPVVRTFETDPVGALPAGCTAPAGTAPAVVSDVRGDHSARSLRIEDASTSTIGEVQCADTTRQGADLRFSVYPASLESGFSYTLLGHLQGIGGAPRPVFHFNVTPTGMLRWYDNSGWTQVAPAGTVPLSAWSTLRVQVPRDQQRAYLYVNGRYVGEGGPWGVRAVADVTGYQFSSAGSATTGDDVFFDNVSIGDPSGSRPETHQPFQVGPDVTVATSSTPIQMPNTAINVRGHGRNEILVSYPAHTDASETAGNRLAVSTDQGATWTDANARNPIPDAPSYGLTVLRNGDILAVDYHTYMTPDSQNLSAEVPTAISHDGGLTWTQRAGTMTTPQAMRTIAPVTDRPGSPMGGFVLVHSVVEDRDGTLYQSGYGYYAADRKYRQIVLKSTDEGNNWVAAATVAVNPDLSTNPRYEGFCEGAIERVADGSLLIVMRTGSYQTMYTSRSSDNGATWSAPSPLVAGLHAQPVTGIYPTMSLLANGRLVLWVGRPGQAMLESADGSGAHWSSPQEIDYANSGNGTFVVVGGNRLLAFGDGGANWSFPTPVTYRVWSRTITVGGTSK